jgi:hypothetical protein
MNDERIEMLEILIGHCRVLARAAKEPKKRIAASQLEIELGLLLDQARGELAENLVPMAANFARRDADPAETLGK